MIEKYRNLHLLSYELFHLNDRDLFHPSNKPTNCVDYNDKNIDWDKIFEIYKELLWAVENPDFDFKSIVFREIAKRYTNKELYYFFCMYYEYYKELLENRSLK